MATKHSATSGSGKLKTILGQPSWRVASKRVEAFVTRTGGQMAPVVFDRRGRKIAPFSVAPWASEKLDRTTPPIIRALRGDFFCMPFGGNATPWRGEKHPIHGETANQPWTFQSLEQTDGRAELRLNLRTRIRPGIVEKLIALPDDHDAVYQRHIVRRMSGPMCFGHHAMLRFPDEPGSGVISTSRFTYAQVFPRPVENPEKRGYSMLQPGAEFSRLDRVPTITGQTTDLSHFPARRGFEDIVMLVADERLPFAWTAVTFPAQRFAWFALKDPRVLRSTIFWLSNGGRHYPPWNGRHVNVMGLEDVTSYFHTGLAESAGENPLSRRGVRTHMPLDPRQPLAVNYIMGIVQLPKGFERVESIEADRRAARGGKVLSDSKRGVRTPVDLTFLFAGAVDASTTNERPRGT